MTDTRPATQPAAQDPDSLEHDEYHSALEIDDSEGWRVFLVPGTALLLVVGAILALVLIQE